MSFIWPVMLVSLLALPLLVVLYLRVARRRKAFTANLKSIGLAPESSGRDPGARRHVPPLLFLAGLAVLLISLARPQATVKLPSIEGTVILAFDVSGSMSADDLQPTRMEAAKAAARDFVARQPSTVKIGVVAFSESGLGVLAPTNDPVAIESAIARLSPQRGTSLGDGIYAALNTLAQDAGKAAPFAIGQGSGGSATPEPQGQDDSAAQQPLFDNGDAALIVMLTDGENTAPPDPLRAAQAAADLGVRIYPVGIGSPQGVTVEVNGFTVHTQLDEGALQQIAQITSGKYFGVNNEEDLRKVYGELIPRLVVKPQKMEVTSLFAGASILFFLVGGVLSLAWFSRMP